ncbi:MAG: DUF1318 domain-containing protein [Verrucomicrobiae bacterium]|nr:DUF1318 domain-containing protein [Verrucomicrobiae bacterium]
MKTLSTFLLMALAGLLLGNATVHAQSDDEEALKKSLLERVDAIDKLKLSGKVGENNVGLLEQRGPMNPDETKLMNAENKDRRALYTLLAKRLNVTMTVVGQGRAEEVRKKSAAGVWLQDRTGNWYQQK